MHKTKSNSTACAAAATTAEQQQHEAGSTLGIEHTSQQPSKPLVVQLNICMLAQQLLQGESRQATAGDSKDDVFPCWMSTALHKNVHTKPASAVLPPGALLPPVAP